MTMAIRGMVKYGEPLNTRGNPTFITLTTTLARSPPLWRGGDGQCRLSLACDAILPIVHRCLLSLLKSRAVMPLTTFRSIAERLGAATMRLREALGARPRAGDTMTRHADEWNRQAIDKP